MAKVYKLLADFLTNAGAEVSVGTLVRVVDPDPSGWWFASWSGGSDWLPSSYLELCGNDVVSPTAVPLAQPPPVLDGALYVNEEADEGSYPRAPTSNATVIAAMTISTTSTANPNIASNVSSAQIGADIAAAAASKNAELVSSHTYCNVPATDNQYSNVAESLRVAATQMETMHVNDENNEEEGHLTQEEISLLYATPKKKAATGSIPPVAMLAIPPPPAPPHQSSQSSDDESDGSGDEAPLNEQTTSSSMSRADDKSNSAAPPPQGATGSRHPAVGSHVPASGKPSPYATPMRMSQNTTSPNEVEYSTLYETLQNPRPMASQILGIPPPPPTISTPTPSSIPSQVSPYGNVSAMVAIDAGGPSSTAKVAPPITKPKPGQLRPTSAAMEGTQSSASLPPTVNSTVAPVAASPTPSSPAFVSDVSNPRRRAPPPPPGAVAQRTSRPGAAAKPITSSPSASREPNNSSSMPSATHTSAPTLPNAASSPSLPVPTQKPPPRSMSVALPSTPTNMHPTQVLGDVVLPVTTSIDIKIGSELAHDLSILREELGAWVGPEGVRSQLQLMHHGRLMKISKGKAQCRDFFLFDHLLVYCKRDRRKLEVRGQLPMSELLFRGINKH